MFLFPPQHLRRNLRNVWVTNSIFIPKCEFRGTRYRTRYSIESVGIEPLTEMRFKDKLVISSDWIKIKN